MKHGSYGGEKVALPQKFVTDEKEHRLAKVSCWFLRKEWGQKELKSAKSHVPGSAHKGCRSSKADGSVDENECGHATEDQLWEERMLVHQRMYCALNCHHYHHHHHQSLNHEGRWGTTDDLATSFLHFSLFSTALWDLPNARPCRTGKWENTHHHSHQTHGLWQT